ncbi:MAG: kynurenine formamidase [Proteobacteria bacterium]|nr:MAG: kynurenine formamidase [Pseudomonadota bacterium]
MKIHDISPVVNEKTPVFPGDQAFERKVLLDLHKGDNIGLSWVKSTVHIGAHTDAPSHYHKEGEAIDKRDLSLYIGDCQVIDVRAVGPRRILPSDLSGQMIRAKRILFKTETFLHDQPFQNNFSSLSPELIDWLNTQGVRLVGIDTPSVDPADSKDLPSHAALYRNDFAVLEGIDLGGVEPGLYELVALPLKLENADASPVRAILLER